MHLMLLVLHAAGNALLGASNALHAAGNALHAAGYACTPTSDKSP